MLLVNPFLQWTEERNRNKRRESQGGDVELDQFKGEYEVFKDEQVWLFGHNDINSSYNFV